MSSSKKIDLLLVKGLCGRCFICLRPPPSYDLILLPPLHTVYVYTVYLVTQGRVGGGEELTREKVRAAMLHKAGRKYQHD
jgi:hypothetical protein